MIVRAEIEPIASPSLDRTRRVCWRSSNKDVSASSKLASDCKLASE